MLARPNLKQLVLSVALSASYVLASPMVLMASTYLWLPLVDSMYKHGWNLPLALRPVVFAGGALVTTLVFSIPFGIPLGFFARRALLWCWLIFLVGVNAVTMAQDALSAWGIELFFEIATFRIYWLPQLGVGVVAMIVLAGILRRERRSNSAP